MSVPFVDQRPWSGFTIVAVAYVIAYVVASIVARVVPAAWSPLAVVAAATLAATLTVFAFSVAFDNTSVYDPYWSLMPPVAAFWLALGPGGQRLDARHLVVLGLVSLYGARLTLNWARGWAGLKHEDWRYVDVRRRTGRVYWLASLFALHLMPSVMTLLGVLPLEAALVSGTTPFGALDVLAALVTLGAIGVEHLADEQLRAFRRARTSEEQICAVGLWAWSRHPNYFGELAFWLGLLLFGLAAGGPWWTGVGFVAMVGLFLGVSIPLMERRARANKPGWKEHCARVSMLLPRPPRATGSRA